MTPDAVPTCEWDRVHELAVEIANASMQNDDALERTKTEELLCYLRELRLRHGDLPSLLGTLGDYTDDEAERYELYARGVAEARRIGDNTNLSILVESILELECLDDDQREFWRTQLKTLKIKPNDSRNQTVAGSERERERMGRAKRPAEPGG